MANNETKLKYSLDASDVLKAFKDISKAVTELEKKLEKDVPSSVDKTTNALEKVSKSSGRNSLFNGKFVQGLSKDFSNMGNSLSRNIPIIGNMSNATASLSPQMLAVASAAGTMAVAIAGSAAAMAGFTALAKRGANIQVISQAFGNIVSGASTSTEVLRQMRNDTRGLISDVELMRLATLSLQGTSSQFRDVVAKDLGKIIDVTNRVAQATGQSAEVVREKFLLGLRRQSKLLLDDVGVMVDAEMAYRRYAEANDLVAKSLTDTQKQAAFAAEALRQLETVGNELGDPNAILANLTKPFVAIKNLIDQVSLAVVPAFTPLANLLGIITDKFSALASVVMPAFATSMQIIGAILQGIITVVMALGNAMFGDLFSAFGTVLPYAVAMFQILGEIAVSAIQGITSVISTIASAIGSIFARFLPPVQQALDAITGVTNNSITSLAYDLGFGGAYVIGAFAGGMLAAGADVAKAAARIAQIVADFLMGFSPPKKGALSEIDKGGANVAKAWAEGFYNGFSETIAKTAQFVNDRLGAIAKFTAQQIENRFSQLDKALEPFQNALDIVKSDLEAITKAVDPALAAIDEQRKKVITALSEGRGDIDTLRQLDNQFDMLSNLGQQQKEIVQQREIALALAQAEQAQERALLNIAKSRIKAVSAVSGGGSPSPLAKTPKEAKPKAPSAGGGTPEVESGGGEPLAMGGAPDLLNNESVQKARENIEAFFGDMSSGIADGLEASGFDRALGEFETSTGDLQTQLARIADADPVESIKNKFSGMEDALTQPFNNAKLAIGQFIGEIVGNIAQIPSQIQGVSAGISGALTGGLAGAKTTAITQMSGFETIFNTPLNAVKTAFTNFFVGEGEGSLKAAINNAFSEGGILGTGGLLESSITNLFGEESPLLKAIGSDGLVATMFGEMADAIGGSGEAIKRGLSLVSFGFDILQLGISNAFSGLITTLTSFADSIDAALGGVLGILDANVYQPFYALVTGIPELLEKLINELISRVNATGLARSLGIEIPSVSGIAGAVGGLVGTLSGLVQGRAVGGTRIKGSFLAGENGAELVSTSRPSNVFPAPVTDAILNLNKNMSMLGSPMAQESVTNNYYNNNTNVNNNLNSMREMRLLQRQQASMGMY